MGASQGTEPRRRERITSACVCIAVLVMSVVGCLSYGFVFWRQCIIPLPDGSGSIIYRARLSKVLCAEWVRTVCLEKHGVIGKPRWVPGDAGGADPVNVYWYRAQGGRGPYVRFRDPLSEYLVDVSDGSTYLLLRRSDGGVYAGVISSPWPHISSVRYAASGECIDMANGHRLVRMKGGVASGPGIYLGRIEYPFNRFLSKEEAAEKALPSR